MKRRKSLLLAALWACTGLFLLTGCDSTDPNVDDNGDLWVLNDDFVASASFSYEVAVAQHARLRLDAINGPVEIHGDPDATSVIVTGQRRVGSESMQDAERHLDDLDVRVDDLTDEIFIKTIQPEQPQGRNYVVDYTITLPENLDLLLDHINGEITLRDMAGNVWVDLINGIIDCSSLHPPTDSLDLFTVNGNIELGIPTSTSAELKASVTNGRISTSNLVLANLVSSPQSMTGRLGEGEGTIDLTVVNGNITVTGH